MAWFLGLQVPVQVAIITAGIGSITLIINMWLSRRNLINLKERRFIDTVSAERIKWLKEIRESFVEFSALTTELATLLDDVLVDKKDNSKEVQRAIELIIKIHSSRKKIKLLLNPTESYVKKLDDVMMELIKILHDESLGNKVDENQLHETHDKVEYLQQIILKAEWKRIITEIEAGKKLNKKQVDEIFESTAKNISENTSGLT